MPPVMGPVFTQIGGFKQGSMVIALVHPDGEVKNSMTGCDRGGTLVANAPCRWC